MVREPAIRILIWKTTGQTNMFTPHAIPYGSMDAMSKWLETGRAGGQAGGWCAVGWCGAGSSAAAQAKHQQTVPTSGRPHTSSLPNHPVAQRSPPPPPTALHCTAALHISALSLVRVRFAFNASWRQTIGALSFVVSWSPPSRVPSAQSPSHPRPSGLQSHGSRRRPPSDACCQPRHGLATCASAECPQCPQLASPPRSSLPYGQAHASSDDRHPRSSPSTTSCKTTSH